MSKWFLLLILIPSISQAEVLLSNLDFFPKPGGLAATSGYYSSTTEINGSDSGVTIDAKDESGFLLQSFNYGILEWLAMEIQIPVTVSRTFKFQVNDSNSSVDPNTGFESPIINIRFGVVHEIGTSIVSLFYSPSTDKDSSLSSGSVGFEYKWIRTFENNWSLDIVTRFLNTQESNQTEGNYALTTAFSAQYRTNSSIYIRPNLQFIQRGQDFVKNTTLSYEIKPYFIFGALVGKDFLNGRLSADLSFGVSSGSADIDASSTKFSTDFSSNTIGVRVSYWL